MSKLPISLISPGIVLVLLLGLGMETLSREKPEDAEPYHARVREAVQTIPFRIGDWIGSDIEVPPAAIQLLRPNVLFNRRYENIRTGNRVAFMLVQTRDARDMAGHYPPICYPANGWMQRAATPRQWEIDGLDIHGVQYEFSKTSMGRTTNWVIYNFMLLPNGQIAPDMDTVYDMAEDYRRHFYGAAQVQMVFYGDNVQEDRDRIFREFLSMNRSIINMICSGVATDE